MIDGPPLDPSAEEARRLLLEELSAPKYQAAKPTWFDLLSKAVGDWFASLTVPDGDGAATIAAVVGVAVVAALIAALLLVGRPRLDRRSAAGSPVFDADDERPASAILAAASTAAAAGQWREAIEEAFRAIARDASDRAILVASPGTTAHVLAERLGVVFPAHAERLLDASRTFDEVRYLGRRGDGSRYEAVLSLGAELRSEHPRTHTSLAETLR